MYNHTENATVFSQYMHNYKENATAVFVRHHDNQTIVVHFVVFFSDDSIWTEPNRTTFSTTNDRTYESTITTAFKTTIQQAFYTT